MIKVITYGTYDMLHHGHIKLLNRAKALGDYLIVGVTSDDFDKTRGKINNQQSLTERVEAIRETGIADQIIVEEYEGQKIDDIKRYDVDIFTVGSDWEGKFDYLNEYSKVIYLPRTEGISSSEIRAKERDIKLGFIGDDESRVLNKYCSETKYVNGASISALCSKDKEVLANNERVPVVNSYKELLEISDAVFILSHPEQHYEHIKEALLSKRHVLVEMPIVIDTLQYDELQSIAKEMDVILMPAMKTAFATAYNRLLLLLKSGIIGKIVAVDVTCTSLRNPLNENKEYKDIWNSICAWGPTALLPVFQILGTEYNNCNITSYYLDKDCKFDAFTKIDFLYNNAVASLKVGRGVKSEGDLVVSGTKGYVYVPAPWWRTDYFEVRFEQQENNKRYFYQLDGEGIRYELVEFVKAIKSGKDTDYISKTVSRRITNVLENFYSGNVNNIR